MDFFFFRSKEVEKSDDRKRRKPSGGQPPLPATFSLLGSRALPDAFLGSCDLGPQHRDAPQVARKRRDALSLTAAAVAVHRKVRQPVDPQGLDGRAHLRGGLSVDGDKVDVGVVRGELA